MPILLTVPKQAVEDPSGVSEYTQVKIKQPMFDLDDKRIAFGTQYGNTIDGVWQPARPFGQTLRAIEHVIYDQPGVEADPNRPDFQGSAPDLQYSTIVQNTKSTAAGQLAYEIVATALYQWLIGNGIYEGTIV